MQRMSASPPVDDGSQRLLSRAPGRQEARGSSCLGAASARGASLDAPGVCPPGPARARFAAVHLPNRWCAHKGVRRTTLRTGHQRRIHWHDDGETTSHGRAEGVSAHRPFVCISLRFRCRTPMDSSMDSKRLSMCHPSAIHKTRDGHDARHVRHDRRTPQCYRAGAVCGGQERINLCQNAVGLEQADMPCESQTLKGQ